MSKELPFYKFTANEWLTGDICFEPFDIQGLFISVCATYWSKDCSITLARLKQRLSNAQEEQWQCLIDGGYIKVENEQVSISFLDEQMNELSEQHRKKVEAGRKGGEASAKQRLSNAKASVKHKDKDVDIEVDKEKEQDKDIPSFDLFLEYALTKEPNIDHSDLKRKYDIWIEDDWNDGYGKPIKRWKVKLINTLPHLKKVKPLDTISYAEAKKLLDKEDRIKYCKLKGIPENDYRYGNIVHGNSVAF